MSACADDSHTFRCAYLSYHKGPWDKELGYLSCRGFDWWMQPLFAINTINGEALPFFAITTIDEEVLTVLPDTSGPKNLV